MTSRSEYNVLLLFLILIALGIGTASSTEFSCAVRDAPNHVAGINVTEICLWDFYNTSVAQFEFKGAKSLELPLSKVERTVIPGTKAHYTVTTTSVTNTTLTSFPPALMIYDRGSELDVQMSLSGNGLPIVVKLKNDAIEEWLNNLQDNFSEFLKGITFQKLLNMSKYIYAFNSSGWAKVRFNSSTSRFEVIQNTSGFNLGNNITTTIKINSIQLSNFWINNSSISSGLHDELKQLTPGYYAVGVVSIDDFDNPTLKLAVPFVVLNGTADSNKPSFNQKVAKGEKLKLTFPRNFGAAFALLLKRAEYDLNVKVDFTKKITKSLNANLTYDGKALKEIELFDKKLGIFAPEGMFIVSYDVDSGKNILEIQTSDLELGDYILYVVSFESDSVTPLYFGSLSVSVQLPDLNVSSITVSPSNPIAGQSVTITATVKNLGDVDAGPFNVSTFANGVLINKNRVNGLSASSETTISFQWTPASAGSYSIRVVADSENEVSEINEANNEKSTTISVSSKPTRRFLPGGGGGGGAIPGVPIYVNPYVSIRAGEEYEIKMPSVTVNDTNVVSIILIPEKNVITKVRVEKISELPEDLPALNNVILALKIDLTLSTETKVRGYVKFVLKRDEIRAKGFDPDNVVATMLKFDGQQWVRLKTEFTGKDDKYNYYKAEVPSFSYFAVILEAPKPTPTTPTTTIPTTVTTVATTTPAVTPAPPPVSIEVVAGIVVLVLLIAIVAYALRRRR